MSPDTTGAPAAQPDRVEGLDLARAYITALTGHPDTIADVRLLHDIDRAAPAIPLRGSVTDLWPTVLAKQAEGYGAFATVNATDGQGVKAENISGARAVWVDLDGPDAEAQYKAAAAFDPPPSFAVSTSPGRWHLYWTLPPGVSLEQARVLTRKLRAAFNGDPAAIDLARVLRLPGSINAKRDESHRVTCHQMQGFCQPVDVRALEGALAHVMVSDHSTSERRALGEPDLAAPSLEWLQRALELADPNELDRDAWIATTAAFKQAGWTLTDEPTLRSIWDDWCQRYEHDDIAENAKQWASLHSTQLGWPALLQRVPSLRAEMSFGRNGPPPLPRAANDDPAALFVRVCDMVSRPPLFLVHGLVEQDALASVFGDPAAGKSLVAIDMAACVATGSPYHGHAVTQGAVFYIAGEGKNGLRRRWAAWEELRGVSLNGAPLFASTVAVQFLDPAGAQRAMVAIDALASQHGPPRFIVIDTVARNFGPGDENSTADMSRFVAALDMLRERWPGCTVLLVHHSGHGEKARGRGSSVMRGAVDCEFRVEKEGSAVTLTNSKMKDAPPPAPMQFEMVDAAGSVALEYLGEPAKRGGLTPGASTALDAFHAVAKEGAADLEAWRTEFYARHASDNANTLRSAFARATQRLVEGRYLTADAGGHIYRVAPMPGQIERCTVA